jgi:hypothetical protein
MVGETRPKHETANNAITVLRNITILRQRYRPYPKLTAGGDRFGKPLSVSTSLLLKSLRATPD